MSRSGPFIVAVREDFHAATRASNLELIYTIWANTGLSLENFRQKEYTAFLAYLSQESSYMEQNQRQFATDSVNGAIALVPLLRNNVSAPRHEVLAICQERFPGVDESILTRTIELAARIWLTTRVALVDSIMAVVKTNYRMLEWPAEISLREAVQSQFTFEDPADKMDILFGPDLDPSLTASALVEICGVKLSWTSNLMDHLQLDKRHRVLTVYEHKICLLNHTKGIDSPYPVDLLHETIDTLNLLFPFGHGPTKDLLRKENKLSLYGLGTCNRERRLKVADYRVWRTQITGLIEVFNEPPRNWWQLLSDRRDLRGWATFWLGPMVLLLTIVSIVTGTVSSVYAVKQYNLARAQACAACAM
ncbi:uncharacterized protein CC84DRAFT_1257822 [Paraphaeosphaeria sporulosa]|uniref:Uncharacterized protein n=1 Tax=Paraphaeosphaeria sporulosa TaxID=1460663 RepID=A0A177CP82_9PLEO|nr:uncharacterized protein CC84DRAFT_1257822 [Paraphaeosphaeria sporulosa]OAG09106.1 hypothetical protein CC84DRAFT_1257822 [Paraphaeosphaeria sporulosa]